jgi:hypothetical protein
MAMPCHSLLLESLLRSADRIAGETGKMVYDVLDDLREKPEATIQQLGFLTSTSEAGGSVGFSEFRSLSTEEQVKRATWMLRQFERAAARLGRDHNTNNSDESGQIVQAILTALSGHGDVTRYGPYFGDCVRRY